MIKYPPLPNGNAIFCDDIREEVTGKRTLVGVYNSEIILSANYPSRIPLLCVEVHFRIDPDTPEQPLGIKITQDTNGESKVVAEVEMAWPGLPVDTKFPDLHDENGRNSVQMVAVLRLHDVLVHGPCGLRAKAFFDGDEYRLGFLGVRSNAS
ncbi:hypothetical protein [Novosphingobium sp. KN65.2]|uniref:hypothetical protein n=1 Tax=Novosphingobium sp. KN65.2 TaxID=1478134 RepID=UPI0012E29D84|nr:hypothetical protein [Novosphingobium sp. KN65.2]